MTILPHIKKHGLRGTCFIIPHGPRGEAVAMAAICLSPDENTITLEAFKAQFEKFGRKVFQVSELEKMIEENRARIFDCDQKGLTQDL